MKITIFIMLMALSTFAKADKIDDGRHQYYGKIIAFDGATVTFKLNCTGATMTFNWASLLGITFDAECEHTPTAFITAPAGAGNCPKTKVYLIKFKNLSDASYADTVSLVNNKLYVHFIKNKGRFTIDNDHLESKIEWMVFKKVCKSDLDADFPVPVN